ncbi:MAG: phosphoglucosamine mutase [Planctomycetes bacterium]|nr:phosphoglucosamine mutase [Planctomycetota bacterium]
MSSERIFGTDGIRGRAGEGWLAPKAVASLGAAVAEVLFDSGVSKQTQNGAKAQSAPRALVGHDGRRSGPELEAAFARGLMHKGFVVESAGLITTPGLALLTKLERFQLSAMLSASHNPAEDNGIKVFSSTGDKLSDELELRIEEKLRRTPALELSGPGPVLASSHEETYLNHLVTQVGAGLRLDGLTIALDCANGGGSRVGPRVFGRLGAHVITMAAEPDGDNINRECGATALGKLVALVRSNKPDIGIALDGDGDRCMLVDETGEIVHGDGMLTLLAREAVRKDEWKDKRLVATVMSNKGLHRALREVGVGVVTVDVGDRRVVEGLRREKLSLGGEQSGHIVFGPDNGYIGDGLYTALRVLRVMRDTKKSLSELANHYRPFPQVLLNVSVARKPALDGLPNVARMRRRVEDELGEDGRVLLRYSGTESLARVMVEGPDLERIRSQAQELATLIAAEIGA